MWAESEADRSDVDIAALYVFAPISSACESTVILKTARALSASHEPERERELSAINADVRSGIWQTKNSRVD